MRAPCHVDIPIYAYLDRRFIKVAVVSIPVRYDITPICDQCVSARGTD